MKNCTNRGFTLTSQVGNFIFECDTPITEAKVIRDFMLSVCLGGTDLRPPKPERASLFVREHMNGPAKHNDFVWEKA